jgi:hypothetical protein
MCERYFTKRVTKFTKCSVIVTKWVEAVDDYYIVIKVDAAVFDDDLELCDIPAMMHVGKFLTVNVLRRLAINYGKWDLYEQKTMTATASHAAINHHHGHEAAVRHRSSIVLYINRPGNEAICPDSHGTSQLHAVQRLETRENVSTTVLLSSATTKMVKNENRSITLIETKTQTKIQPKLI